MYFHILNNSVELVKIDLAAKIGWEIIYYDFMDISYNYPVPLKLLAVVPLKKTVGRIFNYQLK